MRNNNYPTDGPEYVDKGEFNEPAETNETTSLGTNDSPGGYDSADADSPCGYFG